jgi:hypothetical protein
MNNSAVLALCGRTLTIVAGVVFVISLSFPVVAGLSKDPGWFPKLWRVLDIAIALVLVILAFPIITLAGSNVDKQAENRRYRAYRIFTHGILGMFVVFFVFGDRIVWINCLTGFAWRTWLLLYSLPAWLTAFRATANSSRFPASHTRLLMAGRAE